MDQRRPHPLSRVGPGHCERLLLRRQRRRRARGDGRGPSARVVVARRLASPVRSDRRDGDRSWEPVRRRSRWADAEGELPERRAPRVSVHRRTGARRVHRRGRVEDRGLAHEASRLRRGEEMAARPRDPWRAAYRIRALVLPRIPAARGARLCGPVHQPARKPRVRSTVRRGMRRRLGREGLRRPHGRRRPRARSRLGRPEAALCDRRKLWRVHDELDRRPHRSLPGRCDAAEHLEQYLRVRDQRHRLALLGARDGRRHALAGRREADLSLAAYLCNQREDTAPHPPRRARPALSDRAGRAALHRAQSPREGSGLRAVPRGQSRPHAWRETEASRRARAPDRRLVRRAPLTWSSGARRSTTQKPSNASGSRRGARPIAAFFLTVLSISYSRTLSVAESVYVRLVLRSSTSSLKMAGMSSDTRSRVRSGGTIPSTRARSTRSMYDLTLRARVTDARSSASAHESSRAAG